MISHDHWEEKTDAEDHISCLGRAELAAASRIVEGASCRWEELVDGV